MYQNYTLADVKESAERKLFTVFSTFAGGGGSSTGYKLAGGDVRGVLEFQKVGIRTYLQNYPKTKFFCKDIRNVTGEQVLKRLGMEPGELDIFDGSPPCPPFSMSGSKRKGWKQTKTVYGFQQTNIEDLSFDVARMVHVVRPKIFICENVKGMTMEYAHDHFQSIMDAFSDSNSPYWTDDTRDTTWPVESRYEIGWKVLNSKDYGVPQGRERVFIVGIRDDMYEGKLSPREGFDLWGESTGRKAINSGMLEKVFPNKLSGEPSTMRQAIGDMMGNEDNIKEHEEIMEAMKKQKRWKYLSAMPLDVEKYVEMGKYVYDGMMEEWNEEVNKDPEFERANPLHHFVHRVTKEEKFTSFDTWGKDPEGNDYKLKDWENKSYVKYSGFQVRRVPWDKPSHTLTERGLQIGTCAHLHPGEHRGFTTWEAKRLISLPDDYHLDGTLDEKLARIGLMVAPLQMKHLAENVYKEYLQGGI
tara:strand:+ start:561 stop:1973 length:1413 start_codon:yes stop_codon:yes gene_type:complete